MKVYLYIAHLGSGGSERVCVNFANELIHRGHEVHIITLNLDKNAYGHILSGQCILHSLGVSRIRYSFYPLLRLIRKEKPDKIVVFSHELLVWMIYLKNLHLIKTKIILRNQNNLNIAYTEETEISPVVQRFLKSSCRVIQKTDAVIAQCDAMKQQLINDMQIPEQKITCIYNPVSREIVNLAIEKRRNHEKGLHIVMIGRLETQKNTEHLIKAFAMLRQQADLATSTLEIVGEGYEREKLEKLIIELNLCECVTMNGIRKDIENVYADADLIALASTYEGMPNVLIEAISIGIPVVSYNCPVGPAEIIVSDENGYLVPYMDIKELAQRMGQALRKDWNPEQIRKTAEKFSTLHATDQLLQLLESV